jgi:hypothetical protein
MTSLLVNLIAVGNPEQVAAGVFTTSTALKERHHFDILFF